MLKFADVTCYVVGRLCTWLAAAVRVCLGTCYWIRPPRRHHHPPNSCVPDRRSLPAGAAAAVVEAAAATEGKTNSPPSSPAPTNCRQAEGEEAQWSERCGARNATAWCRASSEHEPAGSRRTVTAAGLWRLSRICGTRTWRLIGEWRPQKLTDTGEERKKKVW